MNKVYLVYQSKTTWDNPIIVGAFLDEKECDEYVEEHNKPRVNEDIQHRLCEKCRCCNEEDYDCTHKYDEIFRLENECPLAKIGTDRHGKYCENDIHDYYTMKTDYFWKIETDILG